MLIKGVLLALGALLSLATPAVATTTYVGPLSTTFESGVTTCETSRPSWSPSNLKQIIVEGPALRVTRNTRRFATAKWTIAVYYRTDPQAPWSYLDAWHRFGGPTSALSTTWTFGNMYVPINSAWSGYIAVTEKLELLDSAGRLLTGGRWGPYGENEYRTVVSGYPATYRVFPNVCIFG